MLGTGNRSFLTAEGDGTRLKFTHRGFGQIPDDVLENVGGGWDYILNRIRRDRRTH